MQFHKLKLRFRKQLRLQQRQVEHIGAAAEGQFEQNVVRKFGHLRPVRRFVVSWLLLTILMIGCLIVQTRALSGYYKTLQPSPGGIYTEGIIGDFTNASPLYADGQVDDAVSKLLFASLFKYDDQNHLVGDLAQNYTVDSTGMIYTVTLRPHLSWQDGRPLTADDVVFTYQAIQNPDAQSPLNVSWQNVSVTALNSRTVQFKLPNPLSSFPYSLTTGIIPKHILGTVPMDELRSSGFNTISPIGAGPFQLKNIQVSGNSATNREEIIQFSPFKNYYGGQPKLTNFVIHAFSSQDAMTKSFKSQNISAMVGLQSVPSDIAKSASVESYNMPLTAANMVFFNNGTGILSDASVRQALVGCTNTAQIIAQLGYQAVPVREPFLEDQTGYYNPQYAQSYTGVAAADQLLTNDGWIMQPNGIREKAGKPLSFNLYAQDTQEYHTVTNALQKQWKALGVDLKVYLQDQTGLSSTVTYHNYDALLYGISIGVDPDVYVYWDSTQADAQSTSLNLSSYKSATADAALEAGRTRTDMALREIKYQPFLQAWQQDDPALGLYQPRFLYITHRQVYGLTEHTLNTDTDRFNNVQNWMIRTTPQTIRHS